MSINRNSPTVATHIPDWVLFDTLRKHTLSGELQWEVVDTEDSSRFAHYRAKGGHLEYNLYFEAADPDGPEDVDHYSYDVWWLLNDDQHFLPTGGPVFTDVHRSPPALARLYEAVSLRVADAA